MNGWKSSALFPSDQSPQNAINESVRFCAESELSIIYPSTKVPFSNSLRILSYAPLRVMCAVTAKVLSGSTVTESSVVP